MATTTMDRTAAFAHDSSDSTGVTMPLTLVSANQAVRILDIRGGRKLVQRLYDLGLNPGASVRVIKNDATGPLIVSVKNDGRLALGRGMAHHILVKVD